MKHVFWLFLSVASVAWYLLITGYIAFRGGLDIRSMLREISKMHEQKEEN